MPISEARDQFAEVVNRAAYGGEVTYVTRRGRRLAAVVPATRLVAEAARARETATAEACRQLWASVAGSDEVTRARVQAVIDHLMEVVEDAADVAAAESAMAEVEAGAPTVAWEDLRAELGL
jgi:prevent-host-death family protein